jgi:hypothetical protein
LSGQQYAVNLVRDCHWIVQHIVVPEAQDGKPAFSQEFVPFRIDDRICMLPTVDFDHHLAFHADEIEDKVVTGVLPPEFATIQLAMTQEIPHPSLGIGRIVPQPPLQSRRQNRFVGLSAHRIPR